MINAPSLEGIIDSLGNSFFVIDIKGRKVAISKYTSKKFEKPKINERVTCYFDKSCAYVHKIENKNEEIIYEIKK